MDPCENAHHAARVRKIPVAKISTLISQHHARVHTSSMYFCHFYCHFHLAMLRSLAIMPWYILDAIRDTTSFVRTGLVVCTVVCFLFLMFVRLFFLTFCFADGNRAVDTRTFPRMIPWQRHCMSCFHRTTCSSNSTSADEFRGHHRKQRRRSDDLNNLPTKKETQKSAFTDTENFLFCE